MKIPVTLNGQKTILDEKPGARLSKILRGRGLLSVKCGCSEGFCGACAILLDGKIVPSCIVPAANARDSEIVTLEYFSRSDDCAEIMSAFNLENIKLCGFCDAGKIFMAYQIITTMTRPDRKKIIDEISKLSPCCVSAEKLADGILLAYNLRVDRLGERKNARR